MSVIDERTGLMDVASTERRQSTDNLLEAVAGRLPRTGANVPPLGPIGALALGGGALLLAGHFMRRKG